MTYSDLLNLCVKHGTSDVHTARACEEFGVKPEDATREQRAKAKNMNYVVMYSNSRKISS